MFRNLPAYHALTDCDIVSCVALAIYIENIKITCTFHLDMGKGTGVLQMRL